MKTLVFTVIGLGFILFTCYQMQQRLVIATAGVISHPCFCDTCCEAHWEAYEKFNNKQM